MKAEELFDVGQAAARQVGGNEGLAEEWQDLETSMQKWLEVFASKINEEICQARRKALEKAEQWCDEKATSLGAVDGYDYPSGQEAAYRDAALHFRALKEKEG